MDRKQEKGRREAGTMESLRFIDYFVVCGLGPEISTLWDNRKGYFGTSDYGRPLKYTPALLDQFPPVDHADGKPPSLLPLCVLPGGAEFYTSGPNPNNEATLPRSYPVVLTSASSARLYVSCLAFRDLVDDDIAQAYGIGPKVYVDKCICVVSKWPYLEVFRQALVEIHRLCFSPGGCSKPLWEIIAHLVTAVPLPSPGKGQVLFAVENCLLSTSSPIEDSLSLADFSFQPLVQCLDIDNLIRLFTAVLLERHVLLRSSRYSLLTIVAESIIRLIYPISWMHAYAPVLPDTFVSEELLDAITPFLMGVHSSVILPELLPSSLVLVDLDNNRFIFGEEIPPVPEPELGALRMSILQLVHPGLLSMDRVKRPSVSTQDLRKHRLRKPWSSSHDGELRLIFLRFFASTLEGYRDFLQGPASNITFNKQAFLRKRSRIYNRPPEPMLDQWFSLQNFQGFLEKCGTYPTLLDRSIEALLRGEDVAQALPQPIEVPEIVTVQDSPSSQGSGRTGRFPYDRFPASSKPAISEEKRKAVLEAVAEASSTESKPRVNNTETGTRVAEIRATGERAAERERMVADIKVKIQGLWRKFLQIQDDPWSSPEFGTIHALIESDPEGAGGTGFVECLREHIIGNGECSMSDLHFASVKELLKTVVMRATARGDMLTVRLALEISAHIFRRDAGNVRDYVQRQLGSLPIWEDIKFWEGAFEADLKKAYEKGGNHTTLVLEQLIAIMQHMVGLGLGDGDLWAILESIAKMNDVGCKHLVKLRGTVALMSEPYKYWGGSQNRGGGLLKHADSLQQQLPSSDGESVRRHEGFGNFGRSWMTGMFGREKQPFRRAASEGQSLSDIPTKNGANGEWFSSAHRKSMSGVRLLKGHKGAVTAIHFGGKNEAEYQDEGGYFVSGSMDTTVRLWYPEAKGQDQRVVVMQGHSRAVRTINSDKCRVVSGGDDKLVLVWDKNSGHLIIPFPGHEAKVNCVRLLPHDHVLSASTDRFVRLWDIRSGQCVQTLGPAAGPVFCLDWNEDTGLVASAGGDGMCNLWESRMWKLRHKYTGHTNWIRALRLTKDSVITGSDDWTARVWSVSTGECEAVLACHSGAVTCVEYCPPTGGVITGSVDCTARLWEVEQGGMGTMRCAETVGVHASPILGVGAGQKYMAIGAADNSMSLFHRPAGVPTGRGHARMADWQLMRFQHTAAVVRCIACDVESGRIISGGRNGVLRLWEPPLMPPQA